MGTHHTLINGTSYAIAGGTDLVNGTKYQIGGGRTLVSGTVYEINFDKKCRIEIKNGKDEFREKGYVLYNGQKIMTGAIDVTAGEKLAIFLYSSYGNSYVYLRGDVIHVYDSYNYVVSTAATLSFEFSSVAACRITEE